MNIDAFNANFSSYEKTFLEQQQRQKLLENRKIDEQRQNKLLEQFPNISFNDLKKQKDNIITNDGCVHYKHNNTGEIYSWVFKSNKNEWFIKNDMSINLKTKLFS